MGELAAKLGQSVEHTAEAIVRVSVSGMYAGVNRLISSESQRFPELGAAAAERSARGVQRIARFIRDCAAADAIPCRNAEAAAEVFILMLRGWYLNIMLTQQSVAASERERWVNRSVRVLLSARADW